MSASERRTPRAKPTFQIDTRRDIPAKETGVSITHKDLPPLKSPRTPRFVESTAVISPIEPPRAARPTFQDLKPKRDSEFFVAQPQVADVGFGYVNRHESVEMPDTTNPEYPQTPAKSPGPLKSAMRTPGAPPRDIGAILSPTFREEQLVEKTEEHTKKIQEDDVIIKARIRLAKFMLRGINFSCSLIVLAMLGSTFAIFSATNAIPPRNNLPPWAANQQTWPQILLLVIACISLLCSILIFYGYYRGGHRRAEHVSIYTSVIAVIFFIFSIVMWLVGATVLQSSRNYGGNKDLWGWACVDNARKQLFEDEVSYDLICRMQNWSLICAIIEIVVEVLAIAVYCVIFYRFYSKRQLRKSMANRDKARSTLYLAQLRNETIPGTPAPFSPRDGGFQPPAAGVYQAGPTIEEGVKLETQTPRFVDPVAQRAKPKTFQLQPAPVKGQTPKVAQVGFAPVTPVEAPIREQQLTINTNTAQSQPFSPDFYSSRPPLMSPGEQRQEHFGPSENERVYEDVPIPHAYEDMRSPGHMSPGFPLASPRYS